MRAWKKLISIFFSGHVWVRGPKMGECFGLEVALLCWVEVEAIVVQLSAVVLGIPFD